MTDNSYIFDSNAIIKLKYGNFKNSIYDSKQDLKKMLCQYGPVMITMWADNPVFKSRNVTNNILSCNDFDADRADHAVLLIGYQDNFWIIQNSWGNDWGNHGLFAISMDCGEVSKYFQSYCFVESISGKINYDIKYNEDPFNFNLLKPWQTSIKEFYDESLETGFNSPPIEDSELDTFYSNISQNKMVKTSTSYCNNQLYESRLDWSRPDMNPYKKSIVCETDDQAFCGSCWLFALTNMLQSSISLKRLIKEGKTYNVPLSKQYSANNMKNMKNPFINQKFVCNGGNATMFDHILFGGNFYLNNKLQKEKGVGGIPNELCRYTCQKGNEKCVQQRCSKEVPAYVSDSEEIDDTKKVNLENIWEKYGVYIIILIVIIIIVLVTL